MSNSQDIAKTVIVTGAKVWIGILLYLGINTHLFQILIVLWILDLLTGIAKARALNSKISVSGIIWRGMAKKSLALASILTLALVIKAVAVSGINISGMPITITAALIILVGAEGVSNMQNIYVAYTGKNVDEFDAMLAVMKIFNEIMKSIFNKVLSIIGIDIRQKED